MTRGTLKLQNFTLSEFACKCGCDSDGSEMNEDFLLAIQALRTQAGFPFPITSGYRCPKHPVEARKTTAGSHSRGVAVDIGVTGERALQVLKLALNDGKFTGIGVNQKGSGRFIHLDMDPRTAIWTY